MQQVHYLREKWRQTYLVLWAASCRCPDAGTPSTQLHWSIWHSIPFRQTPKLPILMNAISPNYKYVLLFQSHDQPIPLTSQEQNKTLSSGPLLCCSLSLQNVCARDDDDDDDVWKKMKKKKKSVQQREGKSSGCKKRKNSLNLASQCCTEPPPHSRDAVHGQPPCQQHGLRAAAASCHQQLLQWHCEKAFSLVAAVATILL